MRQLWGTLHIDTAILVALVVILLSVHVFIPGDSLVTRGFSLIQILHEIN